MASRPEIRLALRRSLMKGRIEPMFGVEDVADLNKDLTRFLLQEKVLARLEHQWPSVLVNRVDDDCDCDCDATWSERSVPIDLPLKTDLVSSSSSTVKEVIRDTFWEAQNAGLPVWTVPFPTARRGFFEGLADMIYNRSRWITIKSTSASAPATPKVTVTSSPANQQAKWSKGHFFSISTVFGRTKHEQNVPAGIYCFWLSKDTPTPLFPLYDIQQDTPVPL